MERHLFKGEAPPPPVNWRVESVYNGNFALDEGHQMKCTVAGCPEPDMRNVDFDRGNLSVLYPRIHRHNFKHHPELVPVLTGAGWAVGILSP